MFGGGAHGSSPIFLSNAGNRGSARKRSKLAKTQYCRIHMMLAFFVPGLVKNKQRLHHDCLNSHERSRISGLDIHPLSEFA